MLPPFNTSTIMKHSAEDQPLQRISAARITALAWSLKVIPTVLISRKTTQHQLSNWKLLWLNDCATKQTCISHVDVVCFMPHVQEISSIHLANIILLLSFRQHLPRVCASYFISCLEQRSARVASREREGGRRDGQGSEEGIGARGWWRGVERGREGRWWEVESCWWGVRMNLWSA